MLPSTFADARIGIQLNSVLSMFFIDKETYLPVELATVRYVVGSLCYD
jgi:hypothetical protein